jgi:hypothetical protein
MENKISGVITPTNKTNLEDHVTHARTELPFLKSATLKMRKELRKMSDKNTGYVNAVYTGTMANQGLMPSTFDVDAFKKDMDLYNELPYIRQIFMDFVEQIDDTQLLLGNDLMQQSDMAYSHLKLGAKNNDSVKTLVEEIGKNFTGLGKKKDATVYEIAAASTITVNNVASASSFVNTGSTVLSIKAGASLPSKYTMMDPIKLTPGNSVKVPKGWSSIEVQNSSMDKPGAFEVKIKS